VIEDDVIISVANTDEIVADLEAVQHAHFAGPCIDSITQRRIVYAEEIAVEQSWSAVAAEFVSAEVRGALCLPLVSTTSAASLNLYSRFPAAYSALDRARAVILASLAGVALSAARSHETDIQVSEDLHRALTTREVIGQAQGILMERERVSAHEAFDILRRASQHLNRKLRDIAQELVDTGERPITGDRVTERGPERGPDRARSVAHRARSDRETPTTP